MFQQHIDAILPKIVELRHTIHRHPELCYEEHQTAALVLKTLKEFGYDNIRTGVGGTGVVAILDSGKPGKTVALRADMDALPLQEKTKHDYPSTIEGKMHACGHDGHTATLLAVAYVLQKIKPHINGKIKLIFQPAEEGGAGALAMIKDGALENPHVDAIFGYHNWPTAKAGTIVVREGCLMAAADLFTLTIKGKGGHAALPHLAIDPVYIGASIIMQWQSLVSRFNCPTEPAVISVTQFNGGHAQNVIPDHATLGGTIRSVSVENRARLHQQILSIAENCAKSYRASVKLEMGKNGYPPTLNHSAETALVKKTALQLFTDAGFSELANPIMGAEDFAFFLQERPGCYFFVGNGETTPMCHHPEYDYNDKILPNAITMLCQTALNYLAQ